MKTFDISNDTLLSGNDVCRILGISRSTLDCDDCKQARARKDTIEWRWYDFYAPQGDEPLVICTECQSKPKHVKRVAKDEADYRYEMGE